MSHSNFQHGTVKRNSVPGIETSFLCPEMLYRAVSIAPLFHQRMSKGRIVRVKSLHLSAKTALFKLSFEICASPNLRREDDM